MQEEESEKAPAKVRRINKRWIVHGSLRDNTNAYLDHLAAADPGRLERSCGIALELVHDRRHREDFQDPKPLFYAGLFSLATRGEIERFLGGHVFTRAVLQRVHGESGAPHFPSEDAELLAGRIAEVVSDALAARSRD